MKNKLLTSNLSWVLPPPCWTKFNVDGSSMPSNLEASCGGVLRDELGCWIVGFQRKLSPCSPLQAELWSILTCLHLIEIKGIKRCLVETDSLEVFELMMEECPVGHSLIEMVRFGKTLLSKLEDVHMRHIRRQANGIADQLARQAMQAPYGFQIIQSPPPALFNLLQIEDEINGGPFQEAQQSRAVSRVICNRTSSSYDLCTINGPTALDSTAATFYVMGPTRPTVEKIQPYPRKFDSYIMSRTKNVTIISGPSGPPCKVQHKVPALVFAAGGHTGNFFHDFNDGFIPLFITVNTIFNDQDFVMVVSENPDWWPSKYANLLRMFSRHRVITLENETSTHCFPSAHLGLISHKFMTINQTLLPNSKTYLDFHDMLHKSFGHRDQAPKNPASRPRAVLVCRNGTTGRVIINEKEAIEVMNEVGFDVVVFEPNMQTSLHDSYEIISSSHALIGVHGAALTHSLFLRPGAVFMQIVPIGVEWAADAFFGRVGRGLNLEYIEYRIGVEESSLVDEFGKDNLLLKDPLAVQKNGWPIEIMNTYLKKQNVKLDLVRFKEHLKQAYKKAQKFMLKEG